MSWVKVDDRALAGPVLGRVSRDARLLHIEALAWSMSYDGSGTIPKASLRRATDAIDPDALAAELVRAGVWTSTDDEYRVVFMLDDQLTPDEIARQRDYHRARQERHRRHTKGDHSLCDPRYCTMASRETSRRPSGDASHDASRTRGDASLDASVTVPRPDPTRPKERGRSKDDESARSAASRPAAAPLAPLADGEVSITSLKLGETYVWDQSVAKWPKPVALDPRYDALMDAIPEWVYEMPTDGEGEWWTGHRFTAYCGYCGRPVNADVARVIGGNSYDVHNECAPKVKG